MSIKRWFVYWEKIEEEPKERLEGEGMPLTENQMVIQTDWRTKTGLVVAVDEALSDLPECRIVSMHVQGAFIFLVVEFI